MINLPDEKNLKDITFTYVGKGHVVYFEDGVLKTLTDNLVYHVDSFERNGIGEYLYYDHNKDVIVLADSNTLLSLIAK